jgi:hypothetical protein
MFCSLPRPVTGELRCHGTPRRLAYDPEPDEPSTVASLRSVRANHEAIGPIFGREGGGPADGESLTIELEPAGLVTRGLERDVDGPPRGRVRQGGQREHKRLSRGGLVRRLAWRQAQAVGR